MINIKYVWWTLVIIWMAVIFCLSQMDSKSSVGTSNKIVSKTIEKSAEIINKHPSEKRVKTITKKLNYPTRKMAHGVVYIVLTFLVINAFRSSGIKKGLIPLTLLFCYFYSCTDEIHQLFVGRTGELLDTFIDSIGIVLVLLMYILYNNIKKKNCYNN